MLVYLHEIFKIFVINLPEGPIDEEVNLLFMIPLSLSCLDFVNANFISPVLNYTCIIIIRLFDHKTITFFRFIKVNYRQP